MEKHIKGYKVFDQNLITMNDITFKVGVPMHIDGEIKAGPIDGNGFHLCVYFEDTFRFVNNPVLCEVTGYGTISKEYQDDYNGYYKIYACSDMVIDRVISRKEIIEMAKNLSEERLKRFISTYKMTEEEIQELDSSLKYEYLKKYLDFYQRGNKEAFETKHTK